LPTGVLTFFMSISSQTVREKWRKKV
jgi:hypothetical protein